MPNGAKRYVFTINNPTDDDEQRLGDLSESVKYLVFGREVGENGTYHLQGYVIFNERKTFANAKSAISPRAHVEISRGTPAQASTYAKKDGDFEEFGELPVGQGKRTDWDRLKEWLVGLGRRPSQRELILEFPGLMAKYDGAVRNYVSALLPQIQLTSGTPRDDWQRELEELLVEEPDDRSIRFFVDEQGGKGKTWFCQYMMSNYPDSVQYLRVGKRDDLAYAIDENCSIFLFDIPRSSMEYLQYNILEQIKDRMIFSPKYNSCLKILPAKAHVVVFSNEFPDESKLSEDRVIVTGI